MDMDYGVWNVPYGLSYSIIMDRMPGVHTMLGTVYMKVVMKMRVMKNTVIAQRSNWKT